MLEQGFPRLHEDGTIVICKAVKGVKRKKLGSKEMQKLSKRKRSYELTPRKKRIIKNSGIRQYIKAKNKILFCTLTFPGKVDQKYANKCFSNYVDNLETNYKLNSYVAVKENTKKGTPHFHCLFDLPFTDFKKLNRAWNSTFSDRFAFSNNAFTTGSRKFATDIRQITAYMLKYITKAEKGQDYDELTSTRLYFISNNVLSNPQLIDENTLIYLTCKYEHHIIVSDHYTIYFLKNFAGLPENFIHKKTIKRKKPNKIPDSFQPNLCF